MNSVERSSVRKVGAALAGVFVLGAVLAVRLARRAEARPAAVGGATVPSPLPIHVESLSFPCWGCPDSASWPTQFRTNLDLLAPLGTGTENAAVWFGDFAKPNGRRYPEAEAALSRRIDGPADLGKILPGDDPLLREAEPWCDQATMRFYPDVFPMNGADTQIPNALLMMTLAKSWVARGMASPDPARAMDDFRRGIRLGRLMRQENMVLIDDLVGLADIRFAAQGIYDLARKRGDLPLALAASLVLGEHSAQRLRTAEAVTRLDVLRYVSGPDPEHASLAMPDRKLGEIVDVASKSPDRRFRFEATISLNVVRFLGTPAQQERAAAALDDLSRSPDSLLAQAAAWARDTRPARERFEDAFPANER